jgi:hypothetical protein
MSKTRFHVAGPRHPVPFLAVTLFIVGAAGLLVGCGDGPATAPVARHARALRDECDPTVAIIACPDTTQGVGTNAPTGGIVVPGYPSLEGCYTSNGDGDSDGVNDDCEFAVASAFRPQLEQSSSEADFEGWRNLIGGEYYFAVQKNFEWFGLPGLEIAYLPAYYVDEGTGSLDIQGRHDGDSEYLVVDVTVFQGHWSLVRVFTSAHCASEIIGIISFQANCQWWNADMWGNQGPSAFVDGIMFGAPKVWVSHRKHAFYYSRAQCEGAQLYAEGCGDPIAEERFPITAGFDVGSSSHHSFDLVYPRRGGATCSWCQEDMWGEGFRGWQFPPYTGPDTPRGYGSMLRQFGF